MITSDNTPTIVETFDISDRINESFIFNVNVTGIEVDGSNAYGAHMFYVVKNNSGVLSQVSTLDLTEKTDFISATSQVNISENIVRILVTGEFGKEISWKHTCSIL